MGTAERAAAWIRAAAADSAAGYDQTNRWGPDYDCSSLVITAWEKAGVPVRTGGASYTGNMRRAFLENGFADVTAQTELASGGGMRAGDVLLNELHHTAMVIAPGRIAEAAGNEHGGITGGQTGDQTGREVRESGYYNYPWDCVLRYTGDAHAPAAPGGAEAYTVRPGDTLWDIAERFLGSGARWEELTERNGLTGSALFPGTVLTLGERTEERPSAALPRLGIGSRGEAVRALQTLLTLRGFPCEADGELGEMTAGCLRAFAGAAGLGENGETGETLWVRLIGGNF